MMKNIGRRVRGCAAGLGLLGLCSLWATAEEPTANEEAPAMAEPSTRTPETVIQNWPGRARSTARELISKYGEPNRFDDNDLVWYKNGPWRKTVVYRSSPQGFMHSNDILVQSIGYAVPSEKVAALKSFDGGLKVDKASGELSSASESESLNFLALNLADEIVADKRSSSDARGFYRKTMKLAEAGKSSAYTDGFLFTLSDDKASMQDESALPGRQDLNEKIAPAEEPYRSGVPESTTSPNQ